MHRIAIYMANIVCRSQDEALRGACRALLRSAVGGCVEDDVELRQGIATVLKQHDLMLKKARKAGGSFT